MNNLNEVPKHEFTLEFKTVGTLKLSNPTSWEQNNFGPKEVCKNRRGVMIVAPLSHHISGGSAQENTPPNQELKYQAC